MSNENEDLMRRAYEAYSGAMAATMLRFVDLWSGPTSTRASRIRSRRRVSRE